ncbi:MAG: hypothetical protein HY236_17015 [Acidobacteria bacterium]|nr:hypothetical protein [Acidobacteriota bacterium]
MRPPRSAALFFLFLSVAAFAADRDFNALVKSIESHYGTNRVRIPLLGLTKAFVKVARPYGARQLNLAVFENLPAPGDADLADFQALLREVGPGWQPLVRVHSRRDSETTSIFARPAGRDIHLLVATREREEATLVEIQVTEQLLARWLVDPKRMGECIVVTGDKEAPDCDQE